MTWWKRLANKARGLLGSTTRVTEGGCQHDEIHLRQGTAEFEWFVARGELEMNRDLKHGASHLANLLSYDPGNREWIELLERYLAAAGVNPESLIPRGDQLYYTTEAVRAYIWHRQGRLEEAIGLLTDVVHAKQESRYLEAWALGWLEPDGVIESLSEHCGLRLFSVILNRFPEAKYSPLSRLREIRQWAQLAERFGRRYPGDDMAIMLRAGLFRKAAMFNEALAVVRSAMDKAPSWHTATALGLVLRQQGKPQEAEQAFKKALELAPDDISARLEAGDTYFERGQWQPALTWYESALNRQSQHPWAAPSALFCRWRLTGEDQHLQELLAMAKGEEGNERARSLYFQGVSGGLPEPVDATANLLRQFREQILECSEKAPSGEARMALSSLEAPSNYLAFRMEMASLRHDLRLKVSVNRVPAPDPRKPVAEVKYLLWRYDDTRPCAGLAPPAPDVTAAIAELAAAPYDPMENWAAASRVADEMGPGRIADVLATMVHPPAVPTGWSALAWLPRVQLAAAQVAAQVDEGWDGSDRREALLSILLGPSDWTTTAAILAMSHLGRENDVIAPKIHDAFQQLANNRPNEGYCCWEHTLFSHWLELPHLFPNEREELQRTLREIESRSTAQED